MGEDRAIQRSRLRGAISFVGAAALLSAATAVLTTVTSAPPAFAAGCTASTLVPSAHVDAFSTPTANQFMVNQGLPTYSNSATDPSTALVRGKDTLARLFLSLPSCATSKQSITVTTGMGITVANGSTQLGAGKLITPTTSFALPASYTGAPPANLSTDPIFMVPGAVLAPSTSTASYTATFRISVPYTSSLGSGTASFSATATVAAKTNALRILVEPMGNGTQTLSSQYTANADSAVQQGMNTLSRLYPVPCAADPTDPTASCFRESLTSTFGGIRYAVNPGMLDLSAIAGTVDSNGKYCLGQSNYNTISADLSQYLQSYNSANPTAPADRVVGVLDEAISDGAATSPSGVSCADGMAMVPSNAAFARAMYTTQPSATGGLIAMELEHTFGGIPYPRSSNYHSLNNGDVTAPTRGYNLTQRAQSVARSVMDYPPSPWNNDTTVLEQPDFQLELCNLGGPTDVECTTTGTTGTTNGVAAGVDTLVLTGSTQNTAATTNVVMSFLSSANQPTSPDAAAPVPTSSYRLVQTDLQTGLMVNDVGVKASAQDTDHDEPTGANPSGIAPSLNLSVAVPGFSGVGKIDLYYCGASPTTLCEQAPSLNGGTLLYERSQQSTLALTNVATSGSNFTITDYTNDATVNHTDPAINGIANAVAWVAPCTLAGCAAGATSIHIAPTANEAASVQIPPTPDGGSQNGPAWKPDGSALVFASGGNLYSVPVNAATNPITIGTPNLMFQRGNSNPAADTPTVSADGSTVYFHGSAGGLQSVPFTGGKSSPVVSSPAQEGAPSASPINPKQLAFTMFNGSGGTDVYVLDPTAANPAKTETLVLANAAQPEFGDDGRIYAVQNGAIDSITPAGTGLTQLTTGTTDANPSESHGSFAFDRPASAAPNGRDVFLGSPGTSALTATVTASDPSKLRGELDVQCPNGQVFPVKVGIAPQQLPPSAAQFAATFDGTLACSGTVKLIFKISDGVQILTAGPSEQIQVQNPSQFVAAAITAPALQSTYQPASTIPFNGSGTSVADGFLTGSALQWTISAPGMATITHAGNVFDLAGPAGSWPVGTVTITLVATDHLGHSATATRTVRIDGVAPTINLGTPPANPTTSNSATFNFSATDADTPLTYLCELDGGALTPCAPGVTYTGLSDGTHSFLVYASDAANNTTVSSYTWTVDTIPPVTTASESPPPNGAGWNNGPVAVTLNATDAGTGVATITYAESGATTAGPTTVAASSATFTISNEGVTTVTYHATDVAGNQEATHTLAVRIDTTAPVTTAGESPTPNAAGWNRGPVSVSLTATDAGSGVQGITYSESGGTTAGPTTVAASSATFTISNEGVTTVTYHATDVAGNQEATHTLTVSIDTTAPVTTATESPAANPDAAAHGWYNAAYPGPVTVSLSAADSGSGVQSLSYSVNGGTPTITGGSASIQVGSEGVTTITYSATDVAGNQEATKTLTVRIDTHGPSSTVTSPVPNIISASQGSVTGTAQDNLSGVAAVTVTFVNTINSSQTYTLAAHCTVTLGSCSFGAGVGVSSAVNWSAQLSSAHIPTGVYSVTSQATDWADNKGPASSPVILQVTL